MVQCTLRNWPAITMVTTIIFSHLTTTGHYNRPRIEYYEINQTLTNISKTEKKEKQKMLAPTF